jgi:hypothetical protein
LKEKDILMEIGDYYVIAAPKVGYEIYHNGITHATRIAQIGYAGDRGLQRCREEIEKRQTANKNALKGRT